MTSKPINQSPKDSHKSYDPQSKDSHKSYNPQYLFTGCGCTLLNDEPEQEPRQCPNYSDGAFMCLCCEECRETCEEED